MFATKHKRKNYFYKINSFKLWTPMQKKNTLEKYKVLRTKCKEVCTSII